MLFLVAVKTLSRTVLGVFAVGMVAGCGGGNPLKGADGGSGGRGGAGQDGGDGGPACQGLDEASCKMRPDCFVQECQSCYGQTSVSCYPTGVSPAACVAPPCAAINCANFNEAECAGYHPPCTPVQCPDCNGGQFFAGCAGYDQPIACRPCPPT
jgi:hypothetical protein